MNYKPTDDFIPGELYYYHADIDLRCQNTGEIVHYKKHAPLMFLYETLSEHNMFQYKKNKVWFWTRTGLTPL